MNKLVTCGESYRNYSTGALEEWLSFLGCHFWTQFGKLSCCGDIVATLDDRESTGNQSWDLNLGRKYFLLLLCCCVLLTSIRNYIAVFLTTLVILWSLSNFNIFILYFQANFHDATNRSASAPNDLSAGWDESIQCSFSPPRNSRMWLYSTVTLITVTCLHFQAAFSV